MLDRPASSWMRNSGLPNRLFETDSNDYELYEEDDRFVLSIELPGFDREDVSLSWDDGVLNVAAERDDDRRGKRRTYHRRFRFPKTVDEESIAAEYTNGILEVELPIRGATVRGREIEIEG